MFGFSTSQQQPLRSEASSSLRTDSFKSSEALAKLADQFDSLSEAERRTQMEKTNAIFEVRISNESKQETVWTVDLKTGCRVYPGPAQPPPDITLRMSDDTFCRLADGALDGRTAFFTGRLKTQGNIRLAPKFGGVFANAFQHAKL